MPVYTKMLPVQELREILSPERLALPSSPKVLRILVDEYTDSGGDEALEVYVVLAEVPPEGQPLLRLVGPVFDVIREAIATAGDSRFAYILVGTEENLKARSEYDPED